MLPGDGAVYTTALILDGSLRKQHRPTGEMTGLRRRCPGLGGISGFAWGPQIAVRTHPLPVVGADADATFPHSCHIPPGYLAILN